jgi:glutamyl-tRNA synthetase
VTGRFAPSPTGELHVGNLRTALAAWASCAARGEDFLVRMEDLDRVTSSPEWASNQLQSLAAIGITWMGEPVVQSERFALYNDAIAQLHAQNLVYECFCTRREIAEAAAAPHGGPVLYPGICADLTDAERATKRQERTGALRVRSGGGTETFTDRVHEEITAPVDDVVLRRNDGVPAYNVAVVVDDAVQGITEVVRGADLLQITASQIRLQKLLGLPAVHYAHIPLVVNADGDRLAKRDKGITLPQLATLGVSASEVRNVLWASLGQDGREVQQFSWDAVSREPWVSPWSNGKS